MMSERGRTPRCVWRMEPYWPWQEGRSFAYRIVSHCRLGSKCVSQGTLNGGIHRSAEPEEISRVVCEKLLLGTDDYNRAGPLNQWGFHELAPPKVPLIPFVQLYDFPIWKRPLSSRPRQRGSPETSKTRELNRGRLYFSSVWKGLLFSNWPSQPH